MQKTTRWRPAILMLSALGCGVGGSGEALGDAAVGAATATLLSPGDSITIARSQGGVRYFTDADGSSGWNAGDTSLGTSGFTTDTFLTGDGDGDGFDEIGIWRPVNRRFYLDTDGNNRWNLGDTISNSFGFATDIPVVGDWNGDGFDEIGVWRPANRRFYLDTDGNNRWNLGDTISNSFGFATDIPVVGDWNGDGFDEIGVWRPANRRFYLDTDGNNRWNLGDTISNSFGFATDIPVVGDWNGDGFDEIGVWRPANRRFYLDTDGNNRWNLGDTISNSFGFATDIPVVGDWNGDGFDEIGVWRPANRRFYLDTDGNNRWNLGDTISNSFGYETDIPVVGDWSRVGTFLILGDSMAAATHTNDTCGSGQELVDCLETRLGGHEPTWSYAGGSHSWSLASRLGFSAGHVANNAGDGDNWENDAYDQAVAGLSPGNPQGVAKVFIGLGANDICQKAGHVYTQAQKNAIVAQIDQTLTYLTDHLGAGAEILMAAPPDLIAMHNAFDGEHNNYMFDTCNDLWNLDSSHITGPAEQSMCKTALGSDTLCGWGAFQKVYNDIVADYVDSFAHEAGVDEGPCGSILANGANLAAAAAFQTWLVSTMQSKAWQYFGRNGVTITFTDILQDDDFYGTGNTLYSNHNISRFDCYHPNRAGQMEIATKIAYGLWYWGASEIDTSDTLSNRYDQMNSTCGNDGDVNFAGCWWDTGNVCGATSGADQGYNISLNSGWYDVGKNSSSHRNGRVLQRNIGDVSGAEHVWLGLRHRRQNLDSNSDWTRLMVLENGVGYHEIARYQGGGNDAGEHATDWYDLTPYRSNMMSVCLDTDDNSNMQNGDVVKVDDLHVLSW